MSQTSPVNPALFRCRPDLVFERQAYQGRIYWVVKNPLTRDYFRFEEEEFALLRMFDGRSDASGLRQRFEQQFPAHALSAEELESYLLLLYRRGLLVCSAPREGARLLKQADAKGRSDTLRRRSSLLAIRLKGIDPDAFFDWLYPRVRWFFHRTAVAVCLLLGLAALLLVAVQFDKFQSLLPTFHEFFTPANAGWLALVLAATKILHECGHGLACKHFGGEVHEMGVMFLCFMPCLYCDTTDSWLLSSKWQRAAIGAAGMYVELLLAAGATFVWWFSEPGLVHHLALNVMFVCSVNTLLFNSNPLLRYDGYYILADLLEIPNLRQKARSVLSRSLSQWLLGLQPPHDPHLPQRHRLLFGLYAIASGMYRWVIVFSIAWFLHKAFQPYRLEVVGTGLILAAFSGLLLNPLSKLAQLLRHPERMTAVSPVRLTWTLAATAVLAAGLFWLPLPQRVFTVFVMELRDAKRVYVPAGGRLDELKISPGLQVPAGARLAQLSNPAMDRRLAELVMQRDRQRSQIETLYGERFDNPAVANRIPVLEKSLAGLEEQLARRLEDRQRLTLTAPAAGTVFPAPSLHERARDDQELSEWTETPLAEKNLGCFLETGVLFCLIGDPRRMDAVLLIDQSEIEFVRVGHEVEILLDGDPGQVWRGKIAEIAQVDLQAVPGQLSNKSGGLVATHTDAHGREKPLSAVYQARVPLELPAGAIQPGQTGRAKIHVGRQTVAQAAWRWVTQTFHFRL